MFKHLNYKFSQLKILRGFHGSLRLYFHLLILLSLLPGLLLMIYSLSSKRHCELWVVLITLFCVLKISWFGVERLILRRVNELIALSKRLAAGDLSVRTGRTDSVGLLGELTQAFDQMAASLDSQNKQIQVRANQVAALSELASEIAVEQDLSTLIEQVLEKMMTFLNTSQATVALYDQATEALVLTAAKGLPSPIGMRIKMGEGPMGRAAQTRQPVVVEEYPQGEGCLPEFGGLPYSAQIHIPMVYRGSLVGVLGVAYAAPAHQLSQEEMHLLNLFAEQAASSIKNIYLFKDAHRRFQIMEAINEISTSLRVTEKIDDFLSVLLEKTTLIFNTIIGSIWLYDPADNSLHQVVSNGIPQGENRIKT